MKPWATPFRQPLPAQSLPLPRNRSPGHLRPGRCGAHRLGPWLHQLAAAAPFHQPGSGWRTGGTAPDPRRAVWEVVFGHRRVAIIDLNHAEAV